MQCNARFSSQIDEGLLSWWFGLRYNRGMHELGFAAQILESIEREVREYPNCRVTRVRLRAGDLLAIDKASLAFCLEGISAGTVMEGAAIDLRTAQPELECPRCGPVVVEHARAVVCPRCGQSGGKVRGADELVIEEIELDEGENA